MPHQTHREVYKGHVILIENDDDPTNPREGYYNFGNMVCFHKRYTLGDKDHDFNDPCDLNDYLKSSNGVVQLPVYLYDHSGITMNTTGFSCVWDSEQVGVIYITRKQIMAEHPDWMNLSEKRVRHIQDSLRSEVKAYDDYLTGNVWGFRICEIDDDDDDDEGEELQAVWGFAGDYKYCLEAAKQEVDSL